DRLADLTRDNAAQQANILELKVHINAKMAELKQTIDLRQTQGAAAALAVVNNNTGKTEMDAIRTQIAAMNLIEDNLRNTRLAEMNEAYKTTSVSALLSRLFGIVLTAVVGFLIRRTTLARHREDWLQSGQVGLANAILGDQQSQQLGESILAYLVQYTGAIAGAAYIGNLLEYRRASQYGVPENANIPE